MSDLVVDAVVSAFNPDHELAVRLRSLLPQVRSVRVVDDGSTAPWPSGLPGEIDLIRLPGNAGIATALNTGIARSFDHGADAVLTLDQDSHLPDDGVARLIGALQAGAGADFAVPEYFAGVRQVAELAPDGRLITRRTIQSGLLLPARTFEHLGPLREEFFIDLVDTEYAMRAESRGLVGVAAPGLRLGHQLGAQYRRSGLLGRVAVPGLTVLTLSTPYRYYYRVRNRVLLNRLRLPGTGRWRRRDTVLDLIHFVVVASVARPRRTMVRLMARAFADGLRGRGGRMPAELSAQATRLQWGAERLEEQP